MEDHTGGTGQAGPGELRKVKEGLCSLAALQGPQAGGKRVKAGTSRERGRAWDQPQQREGSQRQRTEPPGEDRPQRRFCCRKENAKGSYLQCTPSPMGTWAARGWRVSKCASAPSGWTGAPRVGSTGPDTPGRRWGPWRAAGDRGFQAGIHGFRSKVQLLAVTPKQ